MSAIKICAFVAVLLFHSTVFATSHLSTDPRVQEARTLTESGKHYEALEILRPLASVHRDQTDVLFLIGFAAIAASEQPGASDAEKSALLDEAIAALHRILVARPELVRVRLELARAFFLKGEDELSRDHFERVLAGDPPAAIAANVRRFLDAIRGRKRWSGYFGFSIAPDTNIGGTSEDDTIYINGLPFRFSDDRVSSGVGVSTWGGGEYQYPIDERRRLRIGADFSRREYKGSDFDSMSVGAHLGPRFLLSDNAEISVLAEAAQSWSGVRRDSRDYGMRVEASRRFTRRISGNLRTSLHQRTYRRNSDNDGPVFAATLSGGYLFTPTIRGDLALGYSRQRTKTERWRNADRWARAGMTFALPYGFTVGGSGEQRWTDYEGDWGFFTPGGKPREDRTRVFRVTILNRAFTIAGFSPQLVLVDESRESNAQLYDYERNRFELRMVRQF